MIFLTKNGYETNKHFIKNNKQWQFENKDVDLRIIQIYRNRKIINSGAQIDLKTFISRLYHFSI